MRSLIVTGPMILNFDLSVRKTVQLAGRLNVQIIVDTFNVLNRVNFVPVSGISNTQLSGFQSSLPTSARTMQIGSRLSW